MPRVRVHQHVNPLAPYFRFAPKPLDLEEVFADPSLPLHLDIGSARGRFLLKMAEIYPAMNFLGIEIREPLVAEANRIALENGLKNLRYEFLNATLWLGRCLENLTPGTLSSATIQFPDPWYKKKHSKRRMVKDEMIDAIADRLAPGGRLFVQTDVGFLAEEMFEVIGRNERLTGKDIMENPYPVKTEREKAVEEKNLPIYRRIFTKK